MLSFAPSLRSVYVSALVMALLFTAALVSPKTAAGQQPTVDLSAPITSLDDAVRTTDSDSVLVALATSLLEAREETKISHSTYRKGVLTFRKHHPTFYGNFFGDPFYASFDVRFQKLAWKRQIAETEINPLNSFWNSTSFFCNPLAYDPAFNGVCRGSKFIASDFFQLPSFLALRHSETRTEKAPTIADRVPPRAVRPVENQPAPESDTLIRPEPIAPPADDASSHSVHVPDEVASRMQQTASDLRRVEFRERIRQTIEEQYGDLENLTPQERAELSSRLTEVPPSTGERADPSPRFRDRLERIEQIRDRREHTEGGRPPERTPLNEPDTDRPMPDDIGSAGSPKVDPPTEFDPPTENTPNRDNSTSDPSNESGAN